jgi:allantoicase
MGDGWETRRSRSKGHNDWAIIKLSVRPVTASYPYPLTSIRRGTSGYLSYVEIDTAHFKGNFPESCELHALTTEDIVPDAHNSNWTLILPRTKLGPHRQHHFQLEQVAGTAFTHIKLTIYPDGGVKRIRVFGARAGTGVIGAHTVTAPATIAEAEDGPGDLDPQADAHTGSVNRIIPVLPLTAEAFTPFGQVVQAYSDPHSAPRAVKITPANQGSASKFHKLSLLKQFYPDDAGATTGLSVYRCQALQASAGDLWEIKLLERHPYTNQAFIPMSGSPSMEGYEGDALQAFGTSYLVIVAPNGADDQPDLSKLRAFVANGGQGIVYNTGIWRE